MQWILLHVLLAIKVGYCRKLEGVTVDYDFNIVTDTTKVSHETALSNLERFAEFELSEALDKTSSAELLGIQSTEIGRLEFLKIKLSVQFF
jgi:hypothetical protein